jgi:hypothetical protein
VTSPQPMLPIAVFRKDDTWSWLCRIPLCGQSEWRGRHVDALADAHKHLRSHREFGFGKR